MKPKIDIGDDCFGCVLNCAVRYCLGRQAYMPKLVIDEVTPMIPYLSNKTLWCFARDIEQAERDNMLGDPGIDAPAWLEFKRKVNDERDRRAINC